MRNIIQDGNMVGPAETGKSQRRHLKFAEQINRWTVRCPQCNQRWLIINVRKNDGHRCEACSHEFLISQEAL